MVVLRGVHRAAAWIIFCRAKRGAAARKTIGFPLFVYRISVIDIQNASMTRSTDIDLFLFVFELFLDLDASIVADV